MKTTSQFLFHFIYLFISVYYFIIYLFILFEIYLFIYLFICCAKKLTEVRGTTWSKEQNPRVY